MDSALDPRDATGESTTNRRCCPLWMQRRAMSTPTWTTSTSTWPTTPQRRPAGDERRWFALPRTTTRVVWLGRARVRPGPFTRYWNGRRSVPDRGPAGNHRSRQAASSRQVGVCSGENQVALTAVRCHASSMATYDARSGSSFEKACMRCSTFLRRVTATAHVETPRLKPSNVDSDGRVGFHLPVWA